MSNNIFPEITCQDGKWFLRVTYNDGGIKEIELPNYPMMNRIWEASSNLLDVYIDDCGGNEYNIELLRKVSKAFAGISKLLSDQADEEQNQLDLDRLYAYDENEPYWNK